MYKRQQITQYGNKYLLCLWHQIQLRYLSYDCTFQLFWQRLLPAIKIQTLLSTNWVICLMEKKKKKETELIASVLKKDTQEIKRMLFNWTKQYKTCTFSRKSSFSSCTQHKNKQLTQLTLYQLDVQRLAEWKGHETVSCPFPYASLRTSNWHKIS